MNAETVKQGAVPLGAYLVSYENGRVNVKRKRSRQEPQGEAHKGAQSNVRSEAPIKESVIHDSRDGISIVRKPNLMFKKMGEVMSEEGTDVEWLVPELLPKSSLVLVTGEPKAAGKTTFVTCLARALVQGTTFLDRQVDEPTPVLYLTEQDQKNLIAEYLLPHGFEEDDPLYLSSGIGLVRGSGIFLEWPRLIEQSIEAANRTGAELIVVDTLSYFAGFGAEEENRSGAITENFRELRSHIAKHDVTFLLIHHDRKGGGEVHTSARGSNALVAMVDLVYRLSPVRKAENIRKLSSIGRLGSVPQELYLEYTGKTYLSHGSTLPAKSVRVKRKIPDLLSTDSSAAMRVEEIREALSENGLEVGRTVLDTVLGELTEEGEVERTGKGVRNDPVRYFRP